MAIALILLVVVVTGIYTWFDAGRPGVKRSGQEDWTVWQRADNRVGEWAAEERARKDAQQERAVIRPTWACRYCGSTGHSTDYHATR